MGVYIPKRLPDFIKLKNESGSSEDVYYSAAFEGLPNEFKTVAEKELDETEDKKRTGMQRLRRYLKKENMPEVDDHSLIAVLRCCKYDLKKSETKLKKFVKTRREILEKVADLDMKEVEMILDDKGIGLLPFRDKHGRLIVFTRPNGMNDDLYSMDSVMLTAIAFAMCLLSFPITSVVGVAYIGECKFRSVPSYLSLLKAYHKYMWNFLDLPIRIGRIDFINEHCFTRWFFNVTRPFLSSKVLGRITFHGSNLENLQKIYHPDILSEEFEGRMGPLDPALYKDVALDFLRKLKAESQALREASQ